MPLLLTQAPASAPEEVRRALEDRVYGCDICQDVCPWNRGIEKRRAEQPPTLDALPTVSLVDWLEADGAELVRDYERLYVPRNDARWLRRNALIALGNVGGAKHRPLLESYVESDDDVLREHATWALARMNER